MVALPRMLNPVAQSERVMINPALQSALDALVKDRRARFEKIIRFREYEAGEKWAELNEDQKTLLNGDPKFSINVCPSILSAACDRLNIQAIQIMDNAALSELIQGWWDNQKLDGLANTVHYAASRDADSYLIISHNGQTPVFTFEPAFDGHTGAMMRYADGKPLYGFKRFTTVDPARPTDDPIERLNMYWPNRIEKYYSVLSGSYLDAGWLPYRENEETDFVQWLTDTGQQNGVPLGLPIIHFRNNRRGDDYGTSDLNEIVPSLQDALNQAGVAELAAAKLAGFPINYIFGVAAPDGQKIGSYPGMMLVHEGSKEGITVGQFPAANLLQLIESKNDKLRTISIISHTPLSYFNVTGQIAAEGTLQQQEAPLLAKVKTKQQDFEAVWEQAVRAALKWEAAFTQDSAVELSMSAIDDLTIQIEWAAPQTRNELAEAQMLQIHSALGVPEEMIWRKLGYTANEIQEMKQIKARQMMRSDIAALRNSAQGVLNERTTGQQQNSSTRVSTADDGTAAGAGRNGFRESSGNTAPG